jgi:hypothetical protein
MNNGQMAASEQAPSAVTDSGEQIAVEGEVPGKEQGQSNGELLPEFFVKHVVAS